jgi:hypothetical protein
MRLLRPEQSPAGDVLKEPAIYAGNIAPAAGKGYAKTKLM